MSDQLTKIEAKILKQLHKEHKTKFKVVRKKIRKLKLHKEQKLDLIYDIVHVNGDLMEVLYQCDPFTDKDDYIATINAYLDLEYTTYDYKVRAMYQVGTMKQLMRVITLKHRVMDTLAKLEKQVFPDEQA